MHLPFEIPNLFETESMARALKAQGLDLLALEICEKLWASGKTSPSLEALIETLTEPTPKPSPLNRYEKQTDQNSSS